MRASEAAKIERERSFEKKEIEGLIAGIGD